MFINSLYLEDPRQEIRATTAIGLVHGFRPFLFNQTLDFPGCPDIQSSYILLEIDRSQSQLSVER